MKNKSYTGKELCHMAENSDKINRWKNCGGSHRKYFPENKEHPPMIIAYHNKPTGKGLCSKILKWFKLVGVLSFLGVMLWIGSLLL